MASAVRARSGGRGRRSAGSSSSRGARGWRASSAAPARTRSRCCPPAWRRQSRGTQPTASASGRPGTSRSSLGGHPHALSLPRWLSPEGHRHRWQRAGQRPARRQSAAQPLRAAMQGQNRGPRHRPRHQSIDRSRRRRQPLRTWLGRRMANAHPRTPVLASSTLRSSQPWQPCLRTRSSASCRDLPSPGPRRSPSRCPQQRGKSPPQCPWPLRPPRLRQSFARPCVSTPVPGTAPTALVHPRPSKRP
mmetsp:Transcript_109889/g.354799  ORF Transcript_109889/g.354799 Transcript_109889/m.354799 type:complete len:247 (+) Transcript_109889:365-1105(+)